MLLTRLQPENWKDLQNQVGRVLTECGFEVEIEKKVQTVRGEVELDVYAEEQIKGRKYSIVVECKNWRANVPQAVIHGFRTVIADIGANLGYIVSSSGFQSGSFSAAELTNLELLTWKEFQSSFFESWYDVYLQNTIASELDGLMTYSEPFLSDWFEGMSEEDKQLYISYKNKYDVFGMIMQSFSSWGRLVGNPSIPTLPLIDRLAAGPERDTIPENILNETYYREFLDQSLEYGHVALAQYRALRNKYKT